MPIRKKNSLMHRLIIIFIPHRHNKYRPWIGRIPGLLSVALILVVLHILINGVNTTLIKIDSSNNTGKDDKILTQINSLRSLNNVQKLKIDSRLESAAQAKADHMMNNQYWAHVAPDGTEAWNFIAAQKYLYQESAENLARGFNTASGVVEGWEASEPHRNAMLNNKYEEVGFGEAKGNLNGENTTVVVALFAKPLDGAALTSADNSKKTLALQGKSIEFVADTVEFSLLNPISLQSTLTLPGKIALIVLSLLVVIYISQHILLKKKSIKLNHSIKDSPIIRLVIVTVIMLLIVITSFGSVT